MVLNDFVIMQKITYLLRLLVRSVILSIPAFFMAPAHASNDLTCTIEGASEITAAGALEALAGRKNYYETVAGAEFIVQRTSGQMMGRFVNNAGWKITVLDEGSAKASYKVLAVRKGGRVQSQFFEVRVQDAGDRKPFVLIAAEVLHGTCTM